MSTSLQPAPIRIVDLRDLAICVLMGLLSGTAKLVGMARPDWHMGHLDAPAVFTLLVAYIIWRARREPEKLDAWGITTPVTRGALLVGVLLFVFAVTPLALTGMLVAGGVDWRGHYFPDMINYIFGAFPQQFAMCSVGLVMLAKLPVFRGRWRLPLLVGLVFSLAHWWTPALIPGTIIPAQMVLTFPVGFVCAWYFLTFRTILPLTAMHAILYVLLRNWVEIYF